MKKIATVIALIFVVFSGYFAYPATFAHAQATGTLSVDTNIERAVDKSCSGSNPFSANCLLYAFYNVILEPSFLLVGLTAKVLDFFLGYSLDSNAYRADFITKGWGLIRDISNIAFIFTLLYLAIRHILGSSSKKYIPTLIIVALLLNFSLFFTKIVIDAGNILARAFYNSIVIENDQTYGDVENYKSITFGLVDKINPQNLLSAAVFQSGAGGVSGDYNSQTNQFNGTVTPDITDKTGTIFGVFILMVIVNLILAWTFLSVCLYFVARVIGLWFAMIFSPIAFVTLAVPGSGSLFKDMSFDSWKDNVIKLSFMAPVFIFFLYLTISFLSIIGGGSTFLPVEGGDVFVNLMRVFIPFIFIIMLLQIAKSTTESMAGKLGGMVKGMVGKALGVVGATALGATAFAGRATVGRVAKGALESGRFEQRITDAKGLNKWQLMVQRNALKKVSESSLDIRNASKAKGIPGWISRQAGTGLTYGMTGFGGDKFNFGKGSDQSRKKYEEEKEKQKIEMAKDLSNVSSFEKKEIESRSKVYKEKIDNEEKELKVSRIEEERIDKRLNELKDLGPEVRTEQESNEIVELQSKQEKIKVKISEKEKAIEDIKNSDEFKGKSMSVEEEKKRRRDEYARTVEDGWIKNVFNPYNIATGNAKQTADKIRSIKDETKKEKAERAAREYMEEQQKEKKDEDKKEEKPKDEDKKEDKK